MDDRIQVWFAGGKVVCYTPDLRVDLSEELRQRYPGALISSLLVPAAPRAIDWQAHEYFNIYEESDAGAGY